MQFFERSCLIRNAALRKQYVGISSYGGQSLRRVRLQTLCRLFSSRCLKWNGEAQGATQWLQLRSIGGKQPYSRVKVARVGHRISAPMECSWSAMHDYPLWTPMCA